MAPFIIDVGNPAIYYAVCYMTAFLVAFILLTIEGVKRKFPLLPWWLVIATTFLLFMIGSQLIKIGAGDWKQVFQNEPLAAWPGRSVLGGILFFVPGLLLARNLLKFKGNVADTFAFLFPLGLAIQRIGCFFAGCCFGIPTDLPWGIQYNSLSPAFTLQVHEHLLPAVSRYSLAVHPVQLYDLSVCLIILLILLRLRLRLNAPGSLLAASILLYGIFRFFLEFVRAQTYERSFYLNQVQLALLIILPSLLFLIYIREGDNNHLQVARETQHSSKRYLLYFLGLVLTFLVVSKWMSLYEIVSFNLILWPIIALIIWQTFKSATHPSFRTATLCLMVVALLSMNQTYPEYSRKDESGLSYFTFGYGVLSGFTDYQFGLTQGSCGPSYATRFDNSYGASAVGFSYVHEFAKGESFTAGLSGMWGGHQEYTSNYLGSQNFSNAAVSPFIQYNWKRIGLGAGLSVGNFTRITSVSQSNSSSVAELNIYPSFNLRIGKLSEGFFEYRLANQFPTPWPALTHQISLGVGMGKKGGVMRVGTGSNASFFMAPSITIADHLILEPYLSFGGGILNGSSADVSGNIAMISMHYKFGRKEETWK